MFKIFFRTSKNILILFLLFIFLFLSFPQKAQARNIFRRFFHDLRRATGFIIDLPDKATRWMGPVLGPIASTALTGNLLAHHRFGQIFKNIRRAHNLADNIEEQKRLMKEVKELYKNEAKDLRQYSKNLQSSKEKLKDQLLNRDIKLSDYMTAVINIDNIIKTVDKTADRFENKAEHLNTGHIIRMASNNLLNQVIGEIKHTALNELNNEISSFISPEIINILSGHGPHGIDALVELIISEDVQKYDGKFDTQEMMNRIKERTKEILKNNKEDIQKNIQDEIKNVFNQIVKDMEKEKEDLDNNLEENIENVSDAIDEKSEEKNPYQDEELARDLKNIPKDEHGCAPGYKWKRMSGVGCVQKDCVDVGAHYSYTQACICGLVNPSPEAKTKSCNRPSNYIACPSCVYACVGQDEECPER